MSVVLIAAALVALGLILRLPARMILAMLALLWARSATITMARSVIDRAAPKGQLRPWPNCSSIRLPIISDLPPPSNACAKP